MTSGTVIFRTIFLIPTLLFSSFLFSTIKVDGKLDEEEWGSAQEISKFYQVGPFTLEEPEQKTVVKVYETEDGLYVGYINYHPSHTMLSHHHERDADNANSDKVGLTVDFYGYAFMAYSFTVSLGLSLCSAVYIHEHDQP